MSKGGSHSRSVNKKPVTTGYQYGGAPSGRGVGFQGPTRGDVASRGGAAAIGAGSTSVQGTNGGNVAINYNNLSGQALADLLQSAGVMATQSARVSDSANARAQKTAQGAIATGAKLAAGSIASADKLSNDLFGKAANTINGAIATNAKLADNANARQAKTSQGAIATNARLADNANARQARTSQGAIAANAALTNDTLTAEAALAKSATDAAGKAYNGALTATGDAYHGALQLLQSNAQSTAAAFTAAAGGQSQQTQITVRNIAYAMAAAVAVISFSRG
ncbi:MAG: hypothetical protein PF501_14685 [Salinisphaera sp.]|jgi:hypothetical protein|nr:hypothetical protein [Salinisphaera sp.]